MSNIPKNYLQFDHDEYAKKRPRNDFWGQIRRTVNGTPVSDEQIAMIVNAVQTRLDLSDKDILLDFACGNGALSQLFFTRCNGYHGVDLSEYLISVAKENFEKLEFSFQCTDVATYVQKEQNTQRFTKALCYGSFSYFSMADARAVLRAAYAEFKNIQRFYIGNLPDKELVKNFYKRLPDSAELTDHLSQIGIWRTKEQFRELAESEGWHVEFFTMPPEYYASHYRYDAVLSRAKPN